MNAKCISFRDPPLRFSPKQGFIFSYKQFCQLKWPKNQCSFRSKRVCINADAGVTDPGHRYGALTIQEANPANVCSWGAQVLEAPRMKTEPSPFLRPVHPPHPWTSSHLQSAPRAKQVICPKKSITHHYSGVNLNLFKELIASFVSRSKIPTAYSTRGTRSDTARLIRNTMRFCKRNFKRRAFRKFKHISHSQCVSE